jgi:hypothetical protein
VESPENSERSQAEPYHEIPERGPDTFVPPEREMSDSEFQLAKIREDNDKELRRLDYLYGIQNRQIDEQITAFRRQADSADKQAQQRIRYGLIAVISGLVILAALYIASLYFFTSQGKNTEQMANNIVASMGVVTGVIGSLVSAYFGIQLGSAGRERAEAQRDRAVAPSSFTPPTNLSDDSESAAG